MNRTDARELLMQMIFQMEAQGDSSYGLMKTLYDDKGKIPKSQKDYIESTFAIVRSHLDDIDDIIDGHSKGWKASRMPKADLAIARLAIAEIVYADDIPDAVAINEAVNLAKKYGSDNAARFINGLLGDVSKGE
jgi:transcription antitermination factor NusB